MRNEEQKEKHKLYMRKYRTKNKDKINTQRRERHKANPYKTRELDRARYYRDPLARKLIKYKITKEQFLQMIDKQNNCCAIYKKEMTIVNIDHCHTTGNVRGLLCTACNTGIGKLKDDVTILGNAIIYLTQV